jgi:NAD(P)-dependent dehydrogenase (short-subunit alcohol dehydrogenase family)
MKIIDSFNLSGKTALVAIPEGPYGKAAALALCEAGAKVYLASDDVPAADKVADAIKKEGFAATVIGYDPAKEESILKLKDRIINESGKLDVFVLDAGERFTASWDAGSAEQLLNNLKKNQNGTMLITKIMGNAMTVNKAGSIIFLSSVYAFVGPDTHNSVGSPEMADGNGRFGFRAGQSFHRRRLCQLRTSGSKLSGPVQYPCQYHLRGSAGQTAKIRRGIRKTDHIAS